MTAAQPLAALSSDSKFGGAPSPSLINSMESKRRTQAVPPSSSVPSIASQVSSSSSTSVPPSDSQAPHNPLTLVTSPSSEILSSSPPTVESGLTPRANKRQSAMPQRPSHSAAYLSKIASEGLTIPGMESREKERDRKAKSGRFWPNFGRAPEKVARPVFGVPLADSIAIASKANLPAVVFRCIEYLEAKHAEEEEGIYRLSGSSAVIKGLKDKFDMEGDVNLRQNDEHWDPHAIAGLLKTFLRDLPHSLLTRDLHQRFLAVMGKSSDRLWRAADIRPDRLGCTGIRAVSPSVGATSAQLCFAPRSHRSPHPHCPQLLHEQDDPTQHWYRLLSHAEHPRGDLLRARVALWTDIRR